MWPVLRSLRERWPPSRPAPSLGRKAASAGSASRGPDPRPQGAGPGILAPPLPCPVRAQTLNVPNCQSGAARRGAWLGSAGAWPSGWPGRGLGVATRVPTLRARRGVLRDDASAQPGGGAGGQAGGGGAGPGPAGTMAKTVAYFYDPDVGNFHYGEEVGRGPPRMFGLGEAEVRGFLNARFRDGSHSTPPGRARVGPGRLVSLARHLASFASFRRRRAPDEAPSLGFDPQFGAALRPL